MFRPDWAETGAFAPHIGHILAEFGAGRVMWGSNYPVEKLAAHYETCLKAVADQVPDHDRKSFFYHSATNTYSLTLT